MSRSEPPESRPVCRYADTLDPDNEWDRKPLTDRLRAWYDPCQRCFPDRECDVEEVVLRKKRNSHAQKLHRPA